MFRETGCTLNVYKRGSDIEKKRKRQRECLVCKKLKILQIDQVTENKIPGTKTNWFPLFLKETIKDFENIKQNVNFDVR